MTTRVLLFLLVLSVSFSSCSRNEALFDIDSYFEMTILAGTSTDRVFGFETEVVFPYEVALANYGNEEAIIDAVKASYCLVYPKFETDTDLSFINELTVDALNPDDLTDDREVFYYEQFNFNRRNELELFPSLPNILDFIRGERLLLRVELIYNTPPPRTFELAFEMKFGAIESE